MTILLLTALLLGVAPADGRIVERIVAVVDDEVVLYSEVESVVDDMMRTNPPSGDVKKARLALRNQILETLISEKLLEQEIRKLRIEVTREEVQRIIDDTMRRRNLDEMKLKAALLQQGLTLAEYRAGLKKQLMKAKIVQLKVKNRVQVSDQDVASTIAKRKLLDEGEFKVRARHILFLVKSAKADAAAKAKAEAALLRIKAGADFAAVATELSEGPSGKSGGSLGVFGRGQMVPAFEKAAFTTKVGDIAGPIRTQFGWHLILVEERVKEEMDSSELDRRVREELYQREVERQFVQYLGELRKTAYIDIRD